MKNKENRKMTKCVRWRWKSFCIIFFCKKNLSRDLAILGFLILALTGIIGKNWYMKEQSKRTSMMKAAAVEKKLAGEEALQKEEEKMSFIQARFDTSSWAPYQNAWYGFSLKYPAEWPKPAIERPLRKDKWEYKVKFSLKDPGENNPYLGFDVKIYNTAKAKELAVVDEFPKAKGEESRDLDDCTDIKGHLLDLGDFSAEEIYLPKNDNCYEPAIFFTNSRGSYIYTIVPRAKDGTDLSLDPAETVEAHMPEFFAVAQSWNLTEIKRPKPVPVKPKINAPQPVSYDVVGGKKVCAKKNDKPGKSDKGKGKHMDMECCLDPDEYPNPHCYYNPSKYGKYL